MREGTARPQQAGQQAGPAVRRVARPHSRSAKQHLQRGARAGLGEVGAESRQRFAYTSGKIEPTAQRQTLARCHLTLGSAETFAPC